MVHLCDYDWCMNLNAILSDSIQAAYVLRVVVMLMMRLNNSLLELWTISVSKST